MDKTTGITIGVIVVLLIGFGIYFMSGPKEGENVDVNATNNDDTGSNATGRVVFSVTDAAANMSNVTEVTMKVNSVAVHNSTDGWVTVSSTPRTYSLLMLRDKNQSELLADARLKAGAYDQISLGMDSVAVKTKSGVTKVATMPSKNFTMNTMLKVNADSSASANFDFLADKSLYTTDKGEYVFAPNVKTETRSNTTVSVDNANVVVVNGGTVDSSSTAGMDLDGTVKLNFTISANQKINLGDGGMTINGNALLK